MLDTSRILSFVLKFLTKLKIDSIFPKTIYDVVLCYHAIENDNSVFSVKANNFNDHIIEIRKNYSLVSMSEILESKNDTNRPRVAITFDDGYKSVYEIAFPILKSYEVSATVFVVGNKSVFKNDNKKILNKKELVTLAKNKWQIGWHTENHVDLRNLSIKELKRDLIRHKNILRKKLGVDIKYVAYPFGIYNERIKRMAHKSGYTAGFSVDGFKANSRVFDKYAIDRVTISSNMSAEDLVTLITPVGLIINSLFTRLWRLNDLRISKSK